MGGIEARERHWGGDETSGRMMEEAKAREAGGAG